jgi:archaellum biogenesis ATPase FlaH
LEKTEQLIIKNLIENPSYAKIVSPFLHKDYFDDSSCVKTIEAITNHIAKYKSIPSYEQLIIDISSNTTIDTTTVETVTNDLTVISSVKNVDKDLQWLVDTTEKFFQINAIKKATFEAVEILTTKAKRGKMNELPDIMRKALKLSFSNTVGVDWGSEKDSKLQYEWYHSKDNRYPIGNLDSFNRSMRGGAQKKRLHVIMGGSGLGKSLFLINFATQFASTGLNVLYVTAEISEQEVTERLDANQLNVESMTLPLIEEQKYFTMIAKAKEKTKGRIFVKEYPTCGVNANHIRALLDELELKEGVQIDFIMLDYLNICSSYRNNNTGDTYNLVKNIAEEFRGLAVEKNLGIFTATQSKRDAMSKVSDVNMDSISESVGTIFTTDYLCAILQPDELRSKNLILVKVLKSRYAQITDENEKFLVGCEKDKQMVFDRGDNDKDGLILDSDANDKSPSQLPNKFVSKKKFKEEEIYDAVDWNFSEK